MKDLYRCLNEYPAEMLAGVAQAWHVDLPKAEPREQAASLAEAMLAPGALEGVVAELSPTAREALATVVSEGGTVPGQGLPLGSPERGDTAHGAAIFVRECGRCHGSNGEGMAAFPPLWGPRSFTIGAGMARLRTLAAFAKHNMPFDRAGTLSDQDAQDVATFITTKPRPPFAASIDDWPRGDAPPDVAYPTKATKTRSP